MSYDLREAFQELAILNEAEEFNLSDEEQIKKMDDFMKGDEFDEVQMVIDVDAEGMDELEPSYEGKIICQCPICKSLVYKAEEDIVEDPTSEYVNVEEACPYCREEGGMLIVGKVAPYPAHEEEKVEDEAEIKDDEANDELKIEDEEEVEEPVEDKAQESLTEEVGVQKFGNEDSEEGFHSARWYIGGRNNFEIATDDLGGKRGEDKVRYTASRWSHTYHNTQEMEDDIKNLQTMIQIVKDLQGKGFVNSELNESLKEDLTVDEQAEVDRIVDQFLRDACAEIAVHDIDYKKENILKAAQAFADDFFFMSESLNEGANEEMAMHALKDLVAMHIYNRYLADFDDNLAREVAKRIPDYDIDWCNEEGDNFIAKGVDQMKHSLARKVADALFANAPRELGEECGKLEEADKPAAIAMEDAQKWVDYDMEHYGKISGKTNDLVKKAGFQIIKDDHGDYEVAAGKYESMEEACPKCGKNPCECKEECQKEECESCDEACKEECEKVDECDMFEDLDTEGLDKLISERLGDTYVTENGYVDGNKITVEGKLGDKEVSYVFEARKHEGGLSLINEDFTIKGRLEDKNIICEDLSDAAVALDVMRDQAEVISRKARGLQANLERVADEVSDELEKNEAGEEAAEKINPNEALEEECKEEELDESKPPYANPNFDEDKYGKYFDDNNKLIPELADEYFALISKQMKEIDTENEKNRAEEEGEVEEAACKECNEAKISDIKGSVGDIIKNKIFPRMEEIDNKEELVKVAEEELANVDDKAKAYAREVLDNLKKKDYYKAAVYLGNVMLAGENLRSPDAKNLNSSLEEATLTEKKWDVSLKSGIALRQAIDGEDGAEIKEALKNCYKEINRRLPDALDDDGLEEILADLDMADFEPDAELDVDEDEARENIDAYLSDFYDFCDGYNIWVEM